MINLEPQKITTWNEPIDMLYACHGRVKRFCHQLSILPDYLEKNGCNQAVRNDVRVIINYFNVAAPLHHEDEELDFFPALKAHYPPAEADINELERQHISIHAIWDKLEIELKALIDGQSSHVDSQLISDYLAAYELHLKIEEPLFELGKTHIPADELTAMGKIMFARRQK